MCGTEVEGLYGLPFDSTENLDRDDDGQPNTSYLPRGLLIPACRPVWTTVFRRALCAKTIQVTTTIAKTIVVVILTSS
jgi:hypothetical protein